MDVDTHLDHLVEQGLALADSAAAAGFDAAVPTCPDWNVRDLVAHVGQVHRWARSYVATGRTTPPGPDDVPEPAPADDELLDWFRAGHDALVTSLREAPADLDCWWFLPAASPLAFWARRQAHETTIHRVDADLAAGRTTDIDPQLAADGLKELLLGFFARSGGKLVSDPARSIAFITDTDHAWTITIGPDARKAIPGAAFNADLLVTGNAATIYLLLWNRGGRDGLTFDGDVTLLDLWREKARIQWR
jgi:uncharacterized protein (TIGR03083 family)